MSIKVFLFFFRNCLNYDQEVLCDFVVLSSAKQARLKVCIFSSRNISLGDKSYAAAELEFVEQANGVS